MAPEDICKACGDIVESEHGGRFIFGYRNVDFPLCRNCAFHYENEIRYQDGDVPERNRSFEGPDPR